MVSTLNALSLMYDLYIPVLDEMLGTASSKLGTIRVILIWCDLYIHFWVNLDTHGNIHTTHKHQTHPRTYMHTHRRRKCYWIRDVVQSLRRTLTGCCWRIQTTLPCGCSTWPSTCTPLRPTGQEVLLREHSKLSRSGEQSHFTFCLPVQFLELTTVIE